MDEKDYMRMEEDAAMAAHCASCAQGILTSHGVDTWYGLYRDIYKWTPCGPWLAVQTEDNKWIDCDDLDDVGDIEVVGFRVGTIVEGSDAEINADWVYFEDCESPADAVIKFHEAVEWVDAEAKEAFWEAQVPRED
jgi:hypothetical protein